MMSRPVSSSSSVARKPLVTTFVMAGMSRLAANEKAPMATAAMSKPPGNGAPRRYGSAKFNTIFMQIERDLSRFVGCESIIEVRLVPGTVTVKLILEGAGATCKASVRVRSASKN